MLETIRAASHPVGLKVSGGLRALRDAAAHLDLTDQTMGPGWATPQTFRIGASGLYEALMAAIEGRPLS
jgi:deoxyribose-phosphate aldolase